MIEIKRNEHLENFTNNNKNNMRILNIYTHTHNKLIIIYV